MWFYSVAKWRLEHGESVVRVLFDVGNNRLLIRKKQSHMHLFGNTGLSQSIWCWFFFVVDCLTFLRSFLAQSAYPHCSWASLLVSLPLSAHSFASIWKLPFLNRRKGENGHRNFFMTKSLWKNVLPDRTHYRLHARRIRSSYRDLRCSCKSHSLKFLRANLHRHVGHLAPA